MNPKLVQVRVIAFGQELTVLMHQHEEMAWLLERALTLSGRHRDDDYRWREEGKTWDFTDQNGHQMPLHARYSELVYESVLIRSPFYLNEPIGVAG